MLSGIKEIVVLPLGSSVTILTHKYMEKKATKRKHTHTYGYMEHNINLII